MRLLPEEEQRLLESYRDLVEQGWAVLPRPDETRLIWDKNKMEAYVVPWVDWLKERAARDGLRLETMLVFAYNAIDYDFSYWAGAARLLGPGGEKLEQLPFIQHRQGHYVFADRDPEAQVRLERTLAALYGPTLAAARHQVARDLIRPGSATSQLRLGQQKTAYPTLPPRGVSYCSACSRYSWARDWDYQDEGTNWRGEACPCCGTWRVLGPKPHESGPLKNQSDAEQEAAADEWRMVPQ